MPRATGVRKIVAIMAGLVGACLIGATSARPVTALSVRQATPFCIGADTHAVLLRAYLSKLVMDTTEPGVTLRDSLRMPVIDTSQITLVSTDSLCQRASHQVDSIFELPLSDTPVYLFKLDTVYAVAQPGVRLYQSVPLTFWSNNFSFLGALRIAWR